MTSVVIKYVDIRRITNSEGRRSSKTDTKGRNRGEPKGLETLAVHDVNDEH